MPYWQGRVPNAAAGLFDESSGEVSSVCVNAASISDDTANGSFVNISRERFSVGL